ncbi:MAG: hypothetical protein QGI46_02925 [Planctomycetota bacterium]|jgi:hypothetical protein|nr:hypothetical protein [Planctomycetota bacterium]
MKPTAPRRCVPNAPRALALTSLLVLSACSSGSDDDDPLDITQLTATQALLPTSKIVVSGLRIAFLADEGTTGDGGTDFNGDGDTLDSIPVALDARTAEEVSLNVAARDLVWVGDELFVVTDESADEADWDGDGDNDERVLLHWSPTAELSWIANLSTDGEQQILLVDDDLLLLARAETLTGPMESSLAVVLEASPTIVRDVLTTDVVAELSPDLVGVDEGLVFLALDEPREGRDLNGDGDSDDGRVLALLDGTGDVAVGYGFALRSTELALPASPSTPLRARATGEHDWLVGFLVDEADQGETNFNDPLAFTAGWQPAHCAGEEDEDATDEVLFFLDFAAWDADPAGSSPVNTGLVGSRRIAIVGDHLATLSPEDGEGTCSLNGDGDQDDDVLRWVRASTPVSPPNSVDDLLAVAAVPGGSWGVAELDGRFVVTIDEAADGRDHDSDAGEDRDLVAWLSPAAGGPFVFDHEPGAGEVFATASWMGEQHGRERLGVAFGEELSGDINGDGDTVDSVPTFARFEDSPEELLFPGFAVAVDADNAGIVIQNEWAFYRVSETEDGADWNGDGDTFDSLLWRTQLPGGLTHVVSILNTEDAAAVVTQDGGDVDVSAWIVNEAQAGDANGDGRADGFAVRYFAW